MIKKIDAGEDVFAVLEGYHEDEHDIDFVYQGGKKQRQYNNAKSGAARGGGTRRTRAHSFGSNGSHTTYEVMSR